MEATASRIAAERYFEISVEGDRTQLVDGVLVMDEPRLIHGALEAEIVGALRDWVRAGAGRGLVALPTGVVMDDYNVFAPDVLWIAERHRPKDRGMRLRRVPDRCVEIRSRAPGATTSGRRSVSTRRAACPSCGWSTTSPSRCTCFAASTLPLDELFRF